MDSNTRILTSESVLRDMPWIPPAHLQPPELAEPLTDYERLIEEAEARRDDVPIARRAVGEARKQDEEAERQKALTDDPTLGKNHDARERRALAELAKARAVNDATVRALRTAAGRVRGLLVKHGSAIEDAAREYAEASAEEYTAVLENTLAKRSNYVGAMAAWRAAARAGATARYERAKSDGELIGAAFTTAPLDVQARFIEWSPPYARLTVGNREIDGNELAAALAVEARQHVQPAPRQRTTDDRLLAGEKPTPPRNGKARTVVTK